MARRLLIPVALVFLVLLILGTLTPGTSTKRDTSTTAVAPASGAPPRTVDATLPKNGQVVARVGDLVNLTVESGAPDGVELPDFGVSEPVAPGAPAIFNVLPTQTGRFKVVSTDSGKTLGVLVVEDRA